MGRTPLVLIGDGKFSSSQRGNRSASTTGIANFLATKFPVFYIDEFKSSISCPKCYRELTVVKGTRNRHWTCKNEACRSAGHTESFLVHKDKSAAINMFLCMISMLMCGKRPQQLRRPTKEKDGDEQRPQTTNGRKSVKRKPQETVMGSRKRKKGATVDPSD